MNSETHPWTEPRDSSQASREGCIVSGATAHPTMLVFVWFEKLIRISVRCSSVWPSPSLNLPALFFYSFWVFPLFVGTSDIHKTCNRENSSPDFCRSDVHFVWVFDNATFSPTDHILTVCRERPAGTIKMTKQLFDRLASFPDRGSLPGCIGLQLSFYRVHAISKHQVRVNRTRILLLFFSNIQDSYWLILALILILSSR